MRRIQKVLFVFFFAVAVSQGIAFAAEGSANRIPILHNGRLKPFEAFARQTLKTVSGSERWEGKDATSVLLEVIKDPKVLSERPWVRIEYGELKTHLGLPSARRFFSLEE